MIRLGSMFSGIGGLELGISATTGARVMWQVERDPFCRSVLAQVWPRVPRYADTYEVAYDFLEPVDWLCAGFPCQPVSNSGKQLGVNDARWLWPEVARATRELRPRILILENVPGLLTANGGGAFGEVLGSLAALRYDAEWGCLRASKVRAPHLRNRVFIVAWDAEAGGGGPAHPHRMRQLQPQRGESNQRGRARDGSDASRGVADTNGEPSERRGGAGNVACPASHVESQGDQRQRRGDAFGNRSQDRGVAQGDPSSRGREGCEVSWGQGQPVADRAGEGVGVALGNPDCAGLEGRGLSNGRRADQRASGPHGGAGGWGSGGAVEPRVGRELDGLFEAVDPRWPAGRGERQHPWEAPRTALNVPNRAARLKALGNAVVPAVAAEVGAFALRVAQREGLLGKA